MTKEEMALQLTLKAMENKYIHGCEDNEKSVEEISKFYVLMFSLIATNGKPENMKNLKPPMPAVMTFDN